MKVQVAKRDNQIDVSMSGDTVDVWQDRTLYWLSASVLTNKLMFDLKAGHNLQAARCNGADC